MADTVESQSASALLGADGPFARELPNFAALETQQRMADAVGQAIEDAGTLVAEAGTGTGKTFAYLVPALLSGRRVIVSTGTRNLQDQLFHRDLPRVRSVLGAKLDAALLKGRANYLCLYRLEQTAQDGTFKSKTQVHDLQTIRAWRSRTRSGDRAELSEEQEGFGAIMPGTHAFILDEAHQIPELAGQFFSVSISARQLSELASDALAECAGQPGALGTLQPALDGLNDAIRKERLAFDPLPQRGAFAQLESSADAHDALVALDEALDTLALALGGQAERSKGLANV